MMEHHDDDSRDLSVRGTAYPLFMDGYHRYGSDRLTPREREVVALMAKGLTNGQIAESLGIAFDTAKSHLSAVITKLEASSREEAVREWRQSRRIGVRFSHTMRTFVAGIGLGKLGIGAAGIAALAGAVAVGGVWLASGGGEERTLGTRNSAYAAEWERLPDPPLAPRVNVVAVWTGTEALFVGGDLFLCPPGANCPRPPQPPLRDGAAFDPETTTWRRISDAPVPLALASVAVLGGGAFFLVPDFAGSIPAFLRYSIADDEWAQLPLPPGDPQHFNFALIATDSAIVAYVRSNEGPGSDYVFNREKARWEDLRSDPMTPGFDRRMVWAESALFLFDREIVERPGSIEPAIVRVARFDPSSGEWTRLADSQMIGGWQWFAEGSLIVDPQLGGADGGQVNNWGRTYPYGGVFDARSNEWLSLPNVPDLGLRLGITGPATGVLGSDSGMFRATSGWFLDLTTDEWARLPELPSFGEYERRNVMTAGTNAISFGGERWGGSFDGEILGDAWIWRSGH
jgi:DNA-binding CsgD family transcriptional regulator